MPKVNFLSPAKKDFNETYKLEVRNIWFRSGKKSAGSILGMISPDPEARRKPSLETMKKWIAEEFRPFADDLDQQVNDELAARMIREKVEMLDRHAETGKEMQNIALTWLRNHEDDINAIAAARILISGIDIERASKGIPKALEKMMQMKDEDIVKRIQDIISRSPTFVEPNIEPEVAEEIISEE